MSPVGVSAALTLRRIDTKCLVSRLGKRKLAERRLDSVSGLAWRTKRRPGKRPYMHALFVQWSIDSDGGEDAVIDGSQTKIDQAVRKPPGPALYLDLG